MRLLFSSGDGIFFCICIMARSEHGSSPAWMAATGAAALADKKRKRQPALVFLRKRWWWKWGRVERQFADSSNVESPAVESPAIPARDATRERERERREKKRRENAKMKMKRRKREGKRKMMKQRLSVQRRKKKAVSCACSLRQTRRSFSPPLAAVSLTMEPPKTPAKPESRSPVARVATGKSEAAGAPRSSGQWIFSAYDVPIRWGTCLYCTRYQEKKRNKKKRTVKRDAGDSFVRVSCFVYLLAKAGAGAACCTRTHRKTPMPLFSHAGQRMARVLVGPHAQSISDVPGSPATPSSRLDAMSARLPSPLSEGGPCDGLA